MNKIVLILVCSIMSMAAYGKVTSTKDFKKLSFSNPTEYKKFVAKLNSSFSLAKGDCNSAYCGEVYDGCIATNIDAIKKETPDIVIEGNMEVQFELTSYCTLLTAFSYSICKENMTVDQATTFLANYNEAKGLLLEAAAQKKKDLEEAEKNKDKK